MKNTLPVRRHSNRLRRYRRYGDISAEGISNYINNKLDLVKAKIAFLKYVIKLTEPVVRDLIKCGKAVMAMIRRIKFSRDKGTLVDCARQIFVIGDTLRNSTAKELLNIAKELFPQDQPNYEAAVATT
jgi:hypothetical protein